LCSRLDRGGESHRRSSGLFLESKQPQLSELFSTVLEIASFDRFALLEHPSGRTLRTMAEAPILAHKEPLLRRELPPRVLLPARATAFVVATVAIASWLYFLPGWIELANRSGATVARRLGTDLPLGAIEVALVIIGVTSALTWAAVGLMILWRRSRDLLGLTVGLGFLTAGLYLSDPVVVGPLDQVGTLTMALYVATVAFVLPWVYVFPDGRWVPRWSILPASIWMAWALARAAVPNLSPARIDAIIPVSQTPAFLLYYALLSSSVVALIFRFARRSDVVQRQQLKWLAYGAALLTVPLVMQATLSVAPTLMPILPRFLFFNAMLVVQYLASTAVPVAAAIAIFRLGLFDIDLLINRTVAYGALTALLVGVFVALSAVAQQVAGPLLGARSDLLTGAIGGVVALAFLPARARAKALADRFLSGPRFLTMLFVDIVGSTDYAVRLGDHGWRELLDRFRAIVRRQLERYGGEEIDTAGDGFFVTFTEPNRAIRCAKAITESVRAIGLEVRAGIHSGEVEVSGAHVSGVAVHASARLMALARPGEIILSSPLRDLVAGSSIETRDRGEHELKGVPGKWRVFSVCAA